MDVWQGAPEPAPRYEGVAARSVTTGDHTGGHIGPPLRCADFANPLPSYAILHARCSGQAVLSALYGRFYSFKGERQPPPRLPARSCKVSGQ